MAFAFAVGREPVTCNYGDYGCATSGIPFIIAGLIALVVLLLLFRLIAARRNRFADQPIHAPAPVDRKPQAVEPGHPLQPPAPPARAREPAPPPKPTPLQIRIHDAPRLTVANFNDASQVQGDFGELLTAVKLSADGWKQLPSKMLGGRGIDGLFVRELRSGGGFEALATETKTNAASYAPASMSDDKLAGDIGELASGEALPQSIADELARALRQGPSFFRKELWRHDLSSGLTTISELGRDGTKGRSVTRSSARLMAALHMSLINLEREAVYVGRKPVDQSGA